MHGVGRDYVIFFLLTAFIVAHFLLLDFPDTEFFVTLMVLSLIGVVMLKQNYRDQQFPFDFDENLNLEKWLWIGGGVAAIYGIGAFFVGVTVPSGDFGSILVPQKSFAISFLNFFQLPHFVNDMLFNVVLVAPSEELCKLVTITALYLFLGQYGVNEKVKLGVSVGLPVGVWAVLHVYSNPIYIGNPWFVVSAFISGIVLIVVLWKTKSILAAILCHGIYNATVIFLAVYGSLLALV